MSAETVSSDEHSVYVNSTGIGFQATCSCGWKGIDRDARSDDYALTNSQREARHHAAGITERDPTYIHINGEVRSD